MRPITPPSNTYTKKLSLPQYKDWMTHNAALLSFHRLMKAYTDDLKQQKLEKSNTVTSFSDWFKNINFKNGINIIFDDKSQLRVMIISDSVNLVQSKVIYDDNESKLKFIKSNTSIPGNYSPSYPDFANILTKVANQIPIKNNDNIGNPPYDHLVAQDIMSVLQGNSPKFYTSNEHKQLFAEFATLLAFECKASRDKSYKQFGINILLLDMIAKKQTYGEEGSKRYLFCNSFDSAKVVEDDIVAYKRTPNFYENDGSKDAHLMPTSQYNVISPEERNQLRKPLKGEVKTSLEADQLGGKSPASTKSFEVKSKGMFAFNNTLDLMLNNQALFFNDTDITANRVLMKQVKILHYWLKNNVQNIPDDLISLNLMNIRNNCMKLINIYNELQNEQYEVEKLKFIKSFIMELPPLEINDIHENLKSMLEKSQIEYDASIFFHNIFGEKPNTKNDLLSIISGRINMCGKVARECQEDINMLIQETDKCLPIIGPNNFNLSNPQNVINEINIIISKNIAGVSNNFNMIFDCLMTGTLNYNTMQIDKEIAMMTDDIKINQHESVPRAEFVEHMQEDIISINLSEDNKFEKDLTDTTSTSKEKSIEPPPKKQKLDNERKHNIFSDTTTDIDDSKQRDQKRKNPKTEDDHSQYKTPKNNNKHDDEDHDFGHGSNRSVNSQTIPTYSLHNFNPNQIQSSGTGYTGYSSKSFTQVHSHQSQFTNQHNRGQEEQFSGSVNKPKPQDYKSTSSHPNELSSPKKTSTTPQDKINDESSDQKFRIGR